MAIAMMKVAMHVDSNDEANGAEVEEPGDVEATEASSSEDGADGEANGAKQRDGKSRRAPWRTQKHSNRKSAPDTDADTAQ